MNKNSVMFKGKKDGINIVLDSELNFEELRDIFNEKVKDANKFFGGTKTSITFSGRILSEHEETELLSIITERSKLDISFVNANSGKPIPKVAETKFEALVSATDNMTHFHMGGLRSGQAIRYAGSVIVIGDVNPGAEIIAEGNIIVIGTLRGLVHAGCAGNADCFVAALNLYPTQLRISDIITYIPDELKKSSKKNLNPSQAFIKDGQIYVALLVE